MASMSMRSSQERSTAVLQLHKARGQIHFHMLLWLKDGAPHHMMHDLKPFMARRAT